MSIVLQLDGLTKRYGGKAAIDGVSVAIADNEYVSLMGPSGSGKTVLLRLIAGFEAPDAGAVLYRGAALAGVPAHRRGIGFVFQNFALFPHLTVFDNIAFGLVNRADAPVNDAAKVKRAVNEVIELVGLTGLAERGVHQISGGQRQRVALARTLVTEPKLVLLDEPLGALDANLRLRMRGELKRIRERLGVAFLHVTGSETEALAMGERVIVLDEGRLSQFATPDAVYNAPASPGVARLLNCYNLFDGRPQGARFATAYGDLPFAGAPRSSARPAYAIRHDRIEIRPAGGAYGEGEAGAEATFIASEYTGSTVMYFFALPDGKIVEVEHHLSHHMPAALEANRPYRLAWNGAHAIVYG
jgi:ABC-type Fe3+/spermidine/putrescine transport system ATPase subunit